MLVVPSTLDAVTVYAEGALCTRLASVPCEGGKLPLLVRLEGLPLGLRPGSLRASVLQGPRGLQVRDIRPTFDVRLPPEADIPTTQRALEEAQEKLTSLAVALERVQRDIATLQKLKPSFPPRNKDEPQQPREASLSSILSLAGFVDGELAALQARQLELERQQRDAVEEVELRRRRLEEGSSAVRGQRAHLARAAVLTLSDVGEVQEGAQLALEYAVPGARWVPGYDLRMPRTLDGGTLRMRASLLQRTGEDWNNVRLSLSTAQLERRAEVPELKALRIGRRQPPPARSGWREPPPGLDELFAGYDSVRPPTPLAPLSQERTHAREFAMPPAQAAEPLMDMRKPVPPPAPPPPPSAAPRSAPMEHAGRITQSMPAIPEMAAPAPARSGAPRPGGPPLGTAALPARKAAAPMLMRHRSVSHEPERDMPAPSMAYAEAQEDDEVSGSFDGAAFGGGGAPMEKEEAPGGASRLEPAADLLDYGGLRLGAPSEPGARGRLHPQGDTLVREQLVLLGVHLHLDVFALVAQSERLAASVQDVPAPTWSVPPRQSTPHFDSRFDVESRADVPSDGVWHTIPVFSAPVGLSAEYVCVPSMEPRAYRTVKVDNRTPYPLLAGPVDVTLGEEFLMTSPLPTLSPGATQRLGLGVEESLKVSRNTRFEEASGGVFGSANMLIHTVRVELANRTSQALSVEVLERVPSVPIHEKDIKVEEAEVRPPWSKRALLPGETPVEGERAWKVLLQPGETQTLSATWAVRIPSSKMLVGGNRRT